MNLELADEIIQELSDPSYVGLLHGQHNAYDKGCRGVMCRKYNRDKVRASYRARHPQALRARSPRDPETDALLTQVIAEHTRQVLTERATQAERDVLASVS
jgi:hypothetical protein